jgi:hypothetical protein
LVCSGRQPDNQQGGGGVGRQQLPADKWMVCRTFMGRPQRSCIELTYGTGDHRQHRPNDALAADIEHRANTGDDGQFLELTGKAAEV